MAYFTHGHLVEDPRLPLDEVDQQGQPTRLTRFVNLLDRCALSLPNGFTADRWRCVSARLISRRLTGMSGCRPLSSNEPRVRWAGKSGGRRSVQFRNGGIDEPNP
jgi:hypothetical protein